MRIRHLLVAALAAGSFTPAVVLSAPASGAPGRTGEVFLVQGVVGTSWDFRVDGEVVGETVEAKEILGGLDLEPGRHAVEATGDGGTTVRAMVDVRPGQSLDVVLHLPVDAQRPAVLTSFVNNRSPVPDGKTRLSIAHTAAVGPADIEVDSRVLFSDVASGEELTVVVPADTYRVAVVPTTTGGPPVLGPVKLPVPAGKAVRVFAVGVAERGTMDAIVHTLPVPVRGSDQAPRGVPGGSGGQHDPGAEPWATALTLGGLVALATSLLLVVFGRGRRAVSDEA